MGVESRTAAPPSAMRRSRVSGSAALRRLAEALLVSGAALVGLAGFHRLDGALAQAHAGDGAADAGGARGIPAGADTQMRLAIPRLGIDLAVFEGVTEEALRRGPGHLPGTPCPGLSGTPGNCVLTGHRDSFFRPLARARAGDLVLLRSGQESRRYRLVQRQVVRPEEVHIAAPTPDARLTLLTCYPFRWIGPAPLRLAWLAEPESVRTSAARAGGITRPSAAR